MPSGKSVTIIRNNVMGKSSSSSTGDLARPNLLVGRFLASSPGVMVRPHNDFPRMIRILGNTIVAKTTRISASGGAAGFTQRVIGNAEFAATPINGGAQVENATDAYAAAGNYPNSRVGPIGQLNLFPKVGPLKKTDVDASSLTTVTDRDRDFNGVQCGWTYRGTYAGEGSNAAWTLRLETKP